MHHQLATVAAPVVAPVQSSSSGMHRSTPKCERLDRDEGVHGDKVVHLRDAGGRPCRLLRFVTLAHDRTVPRSVTVRR